MRLGEYTVKGIVVMTGVCVAVTLKKSHWVSPPFLLCRTSHVYSAAVQITRQQTYLRPATHMGYVSGDVFPKIKAVKGG